MQLLNILSTIYKSSETFFFHTGNTENCRNIRGGSPLRGVHHEYLVAKLTHRGECREMASNAFALLKLKIEEWLDEVKKIGSLSTAAEKRIRKTCFCIMLRRFHSSISFLISIRKILWRVYWKVIWGSGYWNLHFCNLFKLEVLRL